MRHEGMLARAFVGIGGSGRLHSSFVVSILGVLLGVAFLVLTLGVYDSYVQKLESIAFSLYPHVLLFDGQSPPTEDAELSSSGATDQAAGMLEQRGDVGLGQRCERVCAGETILRAERWSSETAGLRLPMSRFVELRRAVEADTAGMVDGVMAPVILEESELLFGLPSPIGQGGSEAHDLSVLAASRPIRVLGIDPSARLPVPRVDLVLGAQQLARLREAPDSIFLADTLWRDVVASLGPEGGSPARLRVQRAGEPPLDLPVAGTFELGFHAVSHNLLITSVVNAQALLGLDDEVSYAGVVLDQPYRSRQFVDAMAPTYDRVEFRATDWTRIAGGDFESIRLFRWILFLVLGLSFLITALGIRNALAILTLERRQQIGILRALGSRDRSLRWIFLSIACGIGLVGAIPGLALGSWASIRFGHWLDRELAGILPIQGVDMVWQPLVLGQVLGLVLVVCSMTSSIAVGKALELDTVDCLREEG